MLTLTVLLHLLQSINLAHVCANTESTAGYLGATDSCKVGYWYMCDAGDYPQEADLSACCNNKGVCTIEPVENGCAETQEHICDVGF